MQNLKEKWEAWLRDHRATPTASIRTARPSWMVALAAVLGPAAAIDTLFSPAFSTIATLSALGLGVGLGGLLGAALQSASSLLRRFPAWLARTVWLPAGLSSGWWLASELGAFARLDGPYRRLAIFAIGAGCIGGLALGGLFALLQPTRSYPTGWKRDKRAWVWGLTLLLTGVATALTYVDRTQFLQLYPVAHASMRWASTLALGAAILWLAPPLARSRSLRRTAAAMAALVVALPYALLHHADARAYDALTERPLSSLVLETSRKLTDIDLDGYSSLLGGGDCAAFRPSVNPGVAEIPSNGIDDNCRYGDGQPPFVGDPDEPVPKVIGPVPSVAIITLDAVRPDHMSVYGYERDTTPNLKRFAREAVVFEHAYTPAPWTSLAIPSLLRGVFPRRMRWTRVGETNKYRLLRVDEFDAMRAGEKLRIMFGLPLDEPRPPISERLQGVGYYTMAVVDDGYSQFLSEKAGTARGFRVYRNTDELPPAQRNDAGTADLAVSTLAARPRDVPFFLWVHLFGPHDPSTKHDGVEQYGTSVADLYDHEIRYADEQLAKVLAALDETAKDRPLAVFIAADHGELLLPNRRLHGSGLHEITTRIPLVVRLPGVTPRRSQALASLVDIPATIVRLAGSRGIASMDGLELRDILDGRTPQHRILFSDTWRFKRDGSPWYDNVSAYDGEHKLVVYRAKNLTRLVRQDDMATPATNLIDTLRIPHLDDAMAGYIEQTGGPPILHD